MGQAPATPRVDFYVLETADERALLRAIARTDPGSTADLGLRRGGVRRLFVIEGFVLGCVGAALGILTAVVVGELVNVSGLRWLPPGGSVWQPLQLRVLGDMTTVVVTSLGLIAVATASAWLPAWRAANLKVVEALRHA